MAVVGPVIARMRAKVSRETAWTYVADPELRKAWWPDAEFEAVLGGSIAERWSDGVDAASRNAEGEIDVLIAGHAFGFRWRDGADEHETAVLFTLRSHESETDIMVTETGFGRFPDAFARTADAQQSWIDLLSDLVAVLATVPPEPEAALESELEVADLEPEPEPEPEPDLAEPEPEPEPSEPEPAEPEPDPAEPDFDSLLRGDTGNRPD